MSSKKKTLWTRNYTLLIMATVSGSVGGIAGGFALSFLVFDETGSTLAAALLLALEMIPMFVIPLVASPIMDRLPRKPFLVGGDAVNGLLYLLAGVYLLKFDFTYIGYLVFSLILTSLSTFDRLAYNSIYPKLIEEGFEDKGYTVSGMLYPVLNVIMAPVAAWLYERIGVSFILIMQGGLSLLAALIESFIKIKESTFIPDEGFSLGTWLSDIKEAAMYLKKEKGLQGIYGYMAVSNGIGNGYYPILTAFFRTAPGFSIAMYSYFSAAEFIGRSLGGLLRYFSKIPRKSRFTFAASVYVIYETMDAILLWLPYPLMLINRAICGFLGINSATLRTTALRTYIPDNLRSRLYAFEEMLVSASVLVFSLIIGFMGEIMPYNLCMTACGAMAFIGCVVFIILKKRHIAPIYNLETPSDKK